MTQPPDQSATIAFLASPAAHGGAGPVEVIETRGALIFLAGRGALKLKRAVRDDGMDLSTPDLRHRMLARELELNHPAAPQIYRDLLPVVARDGGLVLGGAGQTCDWVLRMWRFDAEEALDRIAARGDLDADLADATGAAIARHHRACPLRALNGAQLIADTLDALDRAFDQFPGTPNPAQARDWLSAARTEWRAQAPLLNARGAAGQIRRAHGDLHLRNIVRIKGIPTPIDALEFDETLGTCDLLYDIAFLVMDLMHRDLDAAACGVLSAWLREAEGEHASGLPALPLFLSVRAATQAMALLQTDAARGTPDASAPEIAAYLTLAQRVLVKAPPRVTAVGGLSGSGKSVLARALAPRVGRAPGAVLLSSDRQRKAGIDRSHPLGADQYGSVQRGAVYDTLFDRARALLAAGQSVMLDATFLDPTLRNRAEALAHAAGVPFTGFWLSAPDSVLRARVAARCNDPSDADITVLEIQLARPLGDITWAEVDATGTPDEALSESLSQLKTRE